MENEEVVNFEAKPAPKNKGLPVTAIIEKDNIATWSAIPRGSRSKWINDNLRLLAAKMATKQTEAN